ncbi:MAG TPA: T9SS type A sorting domain-containing protein [Chitinophagaceae bacterium]
MQLKQLLIAVLWIFIASTSFAQPGAVDSAFGVDGWAIYNDGNPDQNDDGFYQMAIQPNGKFIVYRRGYLQRFTSSGQLDVTFGDAGLVDIDFGVRDIAIQADGNILVVSGSKVYKFLGTNGALDEAWGDGGVVAIALLGVQLNYLSIAIDSKGRIVVAGQATFGTAPNITKTTSVARLLADGLLDNDFNGTGIKNQIFLDSKPRSATECEIDASDKIVISVNVAGVFDTEDIIMKYNPDGKLDLTFGGGDGELLTDAKIDRLAVHTNGNIAYSETYIDADQLFLQTFLLNADGSALGRGIYHQHIGVHGLDFQPDGKLVVTSYQAGRLFAYRFNSNGTSDPSFGVSGKVDFVPDGRIRPRQVMYFNNRIFIAGLCNAVFGASEIVHVADGFILALDGTDKKLNCGTLLFDELNLVADPGKCYKTLNNTKYDPAFIPATATGSVQYAIKKNGTVIEQGTGSINGKNIPVGQTQVVYTYTDVTTHSCTYTFNVTDREAPVAKAKSITVQLSAAGAATIAAADVEDGSTDGCTIQSRTISQTNFDCNHVGANTVTFKVQDASGNSSTTTAIVTVEDKVAPEAKCKDVTIYLDATGKAGITAADIDNGSTDACGIKSLSLSKTDYDCSNKGANTITLTATDNNGNTSTCTATVTVIDNVKPIITSVTANPASLWPSDRKMKSVTINTLFTDNCPGTTWRITGVAIVQGNYADNNDPDWQIVNNTTVNLRAEPPKNGIKRVYRVTVTCTDAAGNTSSSGIDIAVAQSAITSTNSARTQLNTGSENSAVETNAPAILDVIAYPNPSKDNFSIVVQTGLDERIMMQVLDIYGRVIETRNVLANSIIHFGENYRSGTYVVRVMQGKEHKEVKLVKLNR